MGADDGRRPGRACTDLGSVPAAQHYVDARSFAGQALERRQCGHEAWPVAERRTVTIQERGETAAMVDLEQRARPFRALYEHWERNQWSVFDLDLRTDAQSFAALDPHDQEGLVWIFAHRFHAEFNVARLLAPFLLAAPDWETQLLLATQTADEHRHLQAVLRIYEEVFGVEGGFEAVQELADRNLDPVAETLYGRFDEHISRLERDRNPDVFLQSVVVYHLLGEGVVARTAQNLAAGQYERFGDFPGLAHGQRLVARDEARHIGFGVSYCRREVAADPERSRALIGEVIDEFSTVAVELLATANDGMGDIVRAGYGVDPAGFSAEAMRLLQLRLRAIGFDDHA
jgi:ribonucleotide reductase beta subunit family protein with ferritin-like domain